MDYKKIKRGQWLYLVLQNGSYTGDPNAIVPVKVIRRAQCNLSNVVVEQDIEGFKHRLTVSYEWLTVLKPQAALDLAFNQAQVERRIHANSWAHYLTRKTAEHEIFKRLKTLPKRKQKTFWRKLKEAKVLYPELFKKNGKLAVSKLKMETWDNMASYILTLEFPHRDMEKHEGKAALTP
jgi:hypothetical protein